MILFFQNKHLTGMQSAKSYKKSIYFIVPAPLGISPGQRFRFENYLPLLQENNLHYHISSFYTLKSWTALYTQGNNLNKALSVMKGFIIRWSDLVRLRKFDYVYVYREAAPIGPPFFEWFIAKVLGKKIIYDFDDAIWIPVSSKYNKMVYLLRNFAKVSKICRWSYIVSVGNQFLASFATKNAKSVVIIPTVVNTTNVHNKLQQHEDVRTAVGWTGTFSTLKYLDLVLPVLIELQKTHDFTFIVIADKDPKLPLKNYRFIKWQPESETDDLLNFHIGLMPLEDDDISRGKCGFKAIQYMSLGIPAIVSPVGVNATIVDHGANGFVSSSGKEWEESLITLLNDAHLRKIMGLAARKKIEDHYSVRATAKSFTDLFS